ncbi:phospholipase D-like domain-containing protein [Ramlibacter sp. AN1015]|uniref:phospholipase D-like domain-containing protein n=1 Tax=Ramlibacter sp. AN1015 TaxID=3133428 RepID=UPI0030C45BD0
MLVIGLVLVLLLGLLVLLVAVLWSIRRQHDVSLSMTSPEGIEQLLPSLAGVALGPLVAGNDVELLENGRYFNVLLERIHSARRSVHVETFLWKDGDIGRRLATALAEAARRGCAVRVLLDANGCRFIGEGNRSIMERAGCRVAFFHDTALRNIGFLNNRDHRKLVVIDGREALVGGHCIVDQWLGNAEDHVHHADLSVAVRGPVVNVLQGVFSENWVGETSEVFSGADVFPHLEPAGDVSVHPAYLKPEGSASAVKILHHTVIGLARERIRIQNPYFIPQPAAIDAFGEAVARGVDVQVLVPATSGSDNPKVQHAAHRNFEKLLRCGVRIFEYPHTLLHQKVMTVDGTWSAIGSSNFDDRSFETNDELTLGILDRSLATRLDDIFDHYVGRADEIQLEAWRRRGIWHKAQDNAFYLFHLLL